MGLVSRLRAGRRERARARAARLELYGAFVAGRRVLYGLERPQSAIPALLAAGATMAVSRPGPAEAFDVVIGDDPTLASHLAPGGILLSPRPPAGLAAVQPFAGEFFVASDDARWAELRLHFGSGVITLPDWINIDNVAYPGVDVRWDAARGVPFSGVQYVFAEHFIEHLSYPQAEQFVGDCRRALRDAGVLRLSTPNLDWVWQTSYHRGEWKSGEEALHDCFVINRAFRGWGHQFVYNAAALEHLLRQAGFSEIRHYGYGQSEVPALAGLERHDAYPDTPQLPHILIVEASGRREPPTSVPPIIAEYGHQIGTR